MLVCNLNEYFLVELLINFDYSCSINEKADMKINMNMKDNNNKNILHHLLSLDKNFMTALRAKSEYNCEINILNILYFITSHFTDDDIASYVNENSINNNCASTISNSGNNKKKKKKKGNNSSNICSTINYNSTNNNTINICLNSNNNNPNLNLNFNELLEKDNEGYCSLSLALIRGYNKVVKYILNFNIIKKDISKSQEDSHPKGPDQKYSTSISKYTVDFNGFNLIHCAVAGKNINNLYLILSYCNIDDLLYVNKDNQTPAEYSKSLNLIYFQKVLKFYENHLNNPLTSNYFLTYKNSTVDVDKLLSEVYCEDNYNETMFLLEKLKLTNSLGNLDNQNNSCFFAGNNNFSKNNNNNSSNLYNHHNSYNLNYNQSTANDYSIRWNHLLCQYNIIKHNNELDNIRSENILSKFRNNYNDSNNYVNDYSKIDIYDIIKEKGIFEKFSNFFTLTIGNISDENIIENPNLLVLLYNKIIFYYKTSNHSHCIKLGYELLMLIKSCSTLEDYYVFFLFTNTTIILIHILLLNNLPFLASILIERLENYIFDKYNDKICGSIDERISNYLTHACILHNGSNNWDEIFSYLHLIKIYRDNIKNYNVFKPDLCKKYISNYEELVSNSKYKYKYPIFNYINIFYECLKIKLSYHEDNSSLCLKGLIEVIYNKISLKKSKTFISSDLNNNDVWLNKQKNLKKELNIFFYNTQGILLLKQKKYQIAEYYFKKALHLIDNYTFMNNSNCAKSYTFIIPLSWIYSINFNLALSLFYQKKYIQSKKIFSFLSKTSSSQINNNPMLYYRIGLCCIEIFHKNCKYLYNNNNTNQEAYNSDSDSISNNSIKNNEFITNNKDNKSSEANICKSFDKNNFIYDNLKSVIIDQLSTNKKSLKENDLKKPLNNSLSKKTSTNIINNDTNNNFNYNLFNTISVKTSNLNNCKAKRITKLTLNTKKTLSNSYKTLINEAIFAFKNILIIIKKDLKSNLNLSGKYLSNLYDLYTNKPYYTDKGLFINYVNSNYNSKTYIHMQIDTYTNLIYCLTLLEKWNEVILFSEQFENSHIYKNELENNYLNFNSIFIRIICYKIQAYMKVKSFESSYNLIEKLVSYSLDSNNLHKYIIDDKLKAEKIKSSCISNLVVFENTNAFFSIKINLVIYYFSNLMFNEGDKILVTIINDLIYNKNLTEYNFPLNIVNLLIYTLLHKNMNNKVINLVKYKNVFELLAELNIIKEKIIV